MVSSRIIVLSSLLVLAFAYHSVTANEEYQTKKIPKTTNEDYPTKKIPKIADEDYLTKKVPKTDDDKYLTKKTPKTTDEDYLTKKVIKTSVVVEGMVYCQNCKQEGTWSLSDAKPISGAKVSVICKNHRNRIFYYGAYTTNEYGYFYAKLEGYTMKDYLLDHPLTACKVKLVSSPDKKCNIPTNVNYGISGASLQYGNKRVLRKDCTNVIYGSGPFAFRSAQCTPETRY